MGIWRRTKKSRKTSVDASLLYKKKARSPIPTQNDVRKAKCGAPRGKGTGARDRGNGTWELKSAGKNADLQ